LKTLLDQKSTQGNIFINTAESPHLQSFSIWVMAQG